MRFGTPNQIFFLFLSDILVLALSLWATLTVRYLAWPSGELLKDHITSFSIIFILWSLVFFIYDLYGKSTIFVEKKLVSAIINAQIINIIIALALFYFIPFGVTPKTNLSIFLIISTGALIIWRRFMVSAILKPNKEIILFACDGSEVEELKKTFKENKKYGVSLANSEDNKSEISTIVFNSHDSGNTSMFSNFYKLLFSGIQFVNIEDLYEEVYGKIPVSIVSERWFLEHVSNSPKPLYDGCKRVIDFTVGLIFGLVSIPIYPLVWLGLKFDSKGSIFSYQTRVGKNNKPIKLIKFRTMTNGDDGGVWGGENKNVVTKFGKILRKTRIDELPQLWNVVRGDVSLIGPRPEFPDPVAKYEAEISYYRVRHMIKPGLSGWAQVYHEAHPHHGLDIIETRNKLSYDLYYIKYRGVWLDVKIILKTIGILLSVKGS